MKHELAKAKQFSKLRAGRSSRLAAWMTSQEALCASVSQDAAAPDDDKIIQPVNVCRPVSSKAMQFVIFESRTGQVKTFHAGMVLSIYRGAAVKSKTTSRRMSMSKPLATASPANILSKARVVVLEELDPTGAMVATPLSEFRNVDIEQICGEIVPSEEGTRGEKIFVSFDEKVMSTLHALQKGELLFGKFQASPKKSQPVDDNTATFHGFTFKSFTRNEAGEKNIEFLECTWGCHDMPPQYV